MAIKLLKWIENHNMTVPIFARRKVKCSPVTIYKLLWGEGTASVAFLERISSATGEEITAGDLIEQFKKPQMTRRPRGKTNHERKVEA
jgi:hypothetical protein